MICRMLHGYETTEEDTAVVWAGFRVGKQVADKVEKTLETLFGEMPTYPVHHQRPRGGGRGGRRGRRGRGHGAY